MTSVAVSIERPRQKTGYAWPSTVRVTYHHGPCCTGTDSSVSWMRDLISSYSSSTSAAWSSNQACE
jgi:hypothetical protein